MTNFGTIKTKILQRLAESYANGNKNDIKEIINVMKSNKDFREMYLFYEGIENNYIDDKNNVKLYVEEIVKLLKEKNKIVLPICETLNKKIGKMDIVENKLYTSLDTLLEDDNLKNIEKKIHSKNFLIEHLSTKKDIATVTTESFTPNNALLHAVLVNNFNVLYGETLSEEQKSELKDVISITDEDLNIKFESMKESINDKIKTLLVEEKDTLVLERLNQVISEMDTMKITKYNYYKLTQLKNGI